MRLQEYSDFMYDQSPELDAKTKLWQAVHKGDYNCFKDLIETNTLSNINEYKFGITLLHALVLNDKCGDFDNDEEVYRNKANIAEYLLSRGADLFAPAQEGAPLPIKRGDTPFHMAELCEGLPFYYNEGIRASFVYTGEHVLPIFKSHLGIETKPSMLFRFGRLCAEHPVAFIGLTAGVMATGLYLKSGGKLSQLPKKIASLRSEL